MAKRMHATHRARRQPRLADLASGEHDVACSSGLNHDVHHIVGRLIHDVVYDAGFDGVVIMDLRSVDELACFRFDRQNTLNDDEAISHMRMVVPLRFAPAWTVVWETV